jgi:hypothetical protein
MGDLQVTLILTLLEFLYSFGSVLGIVALVLYTFPLLGLIFVPMALLYYTISGYYRRSSVETQRLDSILRSSLYGGYSGQFPSSIHLCNLAKITERNFDRITYHSCVWATGTRSHDLLIEV